MEAVNSNAQGVAPSVTSLTWAQVEKRCLELDGSLNGAKAIFGVPTGGCFPALILSRLTGIPLADAPSDGCVVVDDIVDSGRTLRAFAEAGFKTLALYRKPCAPPELSEYATTLAGWVKFPWEKEARPEDAVVRMIQFIGENPNREGLVDTPRRVLSAFRDMTAGYNQNPEVLLKTQFVETCDEMVGMTGIRFTSLCEHHLLPFIGKAAIAYIPDKRVVGISKLARVVECFAKRLQIQERMTNEIAEAIQTCLGPLGVGVVLRAHHCCMGCRGVNQPEAEMVTSALLGVFRSNPSARLEFLSFCRNGN